MEQSLPVVFAGLMAFAMLMYVVLDGYDLGVGLLIPFADAPDRDRMIGSIGPFWDANETWLVLGVGLLLVAFPAAHGIVLGHLYLPVCFMLCGLILRGVAFDFRYKAKHERRHLWDAAFFAGSLIASLAQGVMLGRFVTGFDPSVGAFSFAGVTGIATVTGYALLGAGWLIFKMDDAIYDLARRLAPLCLAGTALGVIAVSAVTPLISDEVFARWFSFPNIFYLAPVPIITTLLFFGAFRELKSIHKRDFRFFGYSIAIFVICFCGLAYSLFPYVVPHTLDIWQAAAATQSLQIMLYGVAVTVPAILAYTALSYYIFRGKSEDLSYD